MLRQRAYNKSVSSIQRNRYSDIHKDKKNPGGWSPKKTTLGRILKEAIRANNYTMLLAADHIK